MELNMCKSIKAVQIDQLATPSEQKQQLEAHSNSIAYPATTTKLPTNGEEVEQHNVECKEVTALLCSGMSIKGVSMINKPVAVAVGTVLTAEKKNDERSKTESTELLGSVTIHNCPGTRTSARVIQKMKQDQTRPLTPPPNERDPTHKKDDRTTQKTPSQVRTHKATWTNLERNYFFDALNEFGKDFEALGNCINSKLKRRTANDHSFKTKDQVRQHYYQTYHKICKYIRFSEEIKKPAQELYVLINYGEMRRKLQFLTEKHFMKLRQLIYQGQITVRCKGKNIRIKTPSCKSLRRLNQLDDSLEDIRLPAKVEVLVTPANMESFGRVQSLAQNPRARTIVPLHKKLVNFIKTFQYKWRSQSARLAEEELKLFPPNTVGDSAESLSEHTEQICFQPKPGVPIHRPLLSITEYLSSVNICLSAYEERIGVKVRSESLYHERTTSVSTSCNASVNGVSGSSSSIGGTVSSSAGGGGGAKRARTESGSEKRSPDVKKTKLLLHSPAHDKSMDEQMLCGTDADVGAASSTMMRADTSSGDELSDELNELLMDMPKTHDAAIDGVSLVAGGGTNGVTPVNAQARKKSNQSSTAATRSQNFKSLLSDDVMARIRNGWTIVNAADITIGDLYVVFGQDSKLELEYFWREVTQPTLAQSTATPVAATTPLIATACDMVHQPSSTAHTQAGPLCVSTAMSTAGNQQLGTGCQDQLDFWTNSMGMQKSTALPYNPSECTDGERQKAVSAASMSNKLKHLLLIANLSERIRKRQCLCGHNCERNVNKTRLEREGNASQSAICVPDMDAALFRQPMPPIRRPITNLDPVKQLTTLTTRQKMSRQVVVQRRLLQPGRQPQQVYEGTQLAMRQPAQQPHEPSSSQIENNKNQNQNVQSKVMAAESATVATVTTATSTTTTTTKLSYNISKIAAAAATPASSSSAVSAATNNNTLNENKSGDGMRKDNAGVDINSAGDCSSTTNKSGDAAAICIDDEKTLHDANCWNSVEQHQSTSPTISCFSHSQLGDDSIMQSERAASFSMPCLDFIEEAMLTTTTATSSLPPDSAYDESTTASFFNGMMSPMQLIRDSNSNSRWLEENINDFSLTSLLGHLDEINATRDIMDPTSSNMSVISESSVDYRHKFQEISALMQSQEKD